MVISSLPAKYNRKNFQSDLLSGVTVGIIALPLSMALAIASGVPPQHGLYTSIFAGIIIAFTGGSRYSVSGPTAAFIVVLLPISQRFGLAGLLCATIIAGLILVGMGLARVGGIIRLIPYPVVIGFNTGIGIVIAAFQVKDFLGIEGIVKGGFISTIGQLAGALNRTHWADAVVGVVTLAVLLIFPKLKLRVPSHLVAVVIGTLFSLVLGMDFVGSSVKTLGTEFQYKIDGIIGNGIPPVLPAFAFPWNMTNIDGTQLNWDLDLVKELALAGFTVAMLGAIESLLCAVVADGMTGSKHNPNQELIGQGLGNIIGPFFGGIPAVAAMARTAANIRAGGVSPVSAIVHGVFLLFTLLFFGQWLAYIPMATLAALLLVVAWNMAETKHFIRIVKVAPRSDVAVLFACVTLTVLVGMVVSLTVGISLASVLFIRRMSDLSGNKLVGDQPSEINFEHSDGVVIYEINGPLFFGAAQKAISTLEQVDHEFKVLVLELSQVNMIDMTGIVALESLLASLKKLKIKVVLCRPAPQPSQRFKAAGILPDQKSLFIAESIKEGLEQVKATNTDPF